MRLARPRVGDAPLTGAERVARHRARQTDAQAVASRQRPQEKPTVATTALEDERFPVSPKEAAVQLQRARDAVHALRYGRADLDAAFSAGAMFSAAQQAMAGAKHLRASVDQWVQGEPALLWLFQTALSGSPWAEEAEEAGWLGTPAT